MNQEILLQTVARLMNPPRGILAIDESMSTCQKRFEALGIACTEETRREYRELLITAPLIENYVSGYIFFDETIRQSTVEGTAFTAVMKAKGMDVGIKVDEGLVDLPPIPGERITKGLEGLDMRLKEYKSLGATFAKWRGVYTISDNTPSEACMKKNAEIFAEYAAVCQAADIVPVVEPEVLTDGKHLIEKTYEVTARNLQVVFNELKEKNVFLPGMILKTSMVLPGKSADLAYSNEDIAKMTVKCLKENVPAEIGGIVFLSGGQDDTQATILLNEMHKLGPLPWFLTFSYGRAIQNGALRAWAQNPSDIIGAQNLLVAAAHNNSLASIGEYNNEPTKIPPEK